MAESEQSDDSEKTGKMAENVRFPSSYIGRREEDGVKQYVLMVFHKKEWERFGQKMGRDVVRVLTIVSWCFMF